MKKRIIVFAMLLSVIFAAVGLADQDAPATSGDAWIRAGFYPVAEVMEKAGYARAGDYAYEAQVADAVAVRIAFDPSGKTCSKNQYVFDLTDDQFRLSDGALYLSRSALETILACDVSCGEDGVALSPRAYAPGEWTRLTRLIAHAGGAARRSDYYATYTNSVEALAENYALGHRVFEFDFQLTSDGGLALVHDWKKHGASDGEALTAEAWKASKDPGYPATEGRFTTMLVEDLLDQMLVNPDIFVVTDTKSRKNTDEEVVRKFELLRDAALARDPELLDRIVPQVYDPATYELTQSVYPWRSVVYTTYDNDLPADEIIRFAAQKDNIHVVTANYKDERFAEAEIRRVHDAGLLFYTHTLNSYKELTHERGRGVDGLYTDLLVQGQWDAYDRFAANGGSAGSGAEIATQEPEDSGEADVPEEDAPEEDDSQALFFRPAAEVSETFEGFLKYAASLKSCVTLLAIRGEGVQGLSSGALDMLGKLGIKADLSVADSCSFVAAIKERSVVEKAGYEAVERSGKLSDDAKYALRSAGEFCGDSCSIVIDGEEYAPNARGFNVVVYSTALHAVVHTGVYDTHVAG